MRRLAVAAMTVGLALGGFSRPAAGQANITPRPYVELIFSRTELTAADGGTTCRADDTNIARLDTTVAPYLHHLGLAATGSIETALTQPTLNSCTHYNETEVASWSQIRGLAAAGWTFVSHSADYPSTAAMWSALTPAQQWEETCGSAQSIDAHGVPGGDTMYLWPDQSGQPGNINTYVRAHFVEPCFGTERAYGAGITVGPDLNSAPYTQSVGGLHGGDCNIRAAACWRTPSAISHYATPATIIARVKALHAGQVMTLQDYLLVTGTSPAYGNSADRWDCTATDPNLHWTNDIERYCYTDWQQVVDYLAASGIGITQPGAVAAVFGRTNFGDHAVPRP